MTDVVRDYRSVHGAVRSHLTTLWPDRAIESFVWMQGPISRSIPDFHVLRVAPLTSNEPWVYVSCGAWEVATTFGDRLEFALLSPIESPAHIETLAMLANLHADEDRAVAPGSIIDIGRPWMDGATCDHLLVSVPYPLGSRFEHLAVPRSTIRIRFLWLMPITGDEAAFARAVGVEALEQRFEDLGVDCLDRRRGSVLRAG